MQRQDVWAMGNEAAADLEHSRRLVVDQIQAAWLRHEPVVAEASLGAELVRLAGRRDSPRSPHPPACKFLKRLNDVSTSRQRRE